MRAIRRFTIAVVTLFLALQCFGQSRRILVPLPVAVTTGKAKVTIHGTGASSGDSIRIDVAKGPKAPPGPLRMYISPGTILENGNSAGQGMVISGVRGRVTSEYTYEPTSVIVVTGKTPVTYLLSAFCTAFEKDNPSPNDTFGFARRDPVLACILRNSVNLSVPARQAAVWIYTDQVDYAQMSQKFQVTEQEFEEGQGVTSRCQVAR